MKLSIPRTEELPGNTRGDPKVHGGVMDMADVIPDAGMAPLSVHHMQ